MIVVSTMLALDLLFRAHFILGNTYSLLTNFRYGVELRNGE